MGVPLTEATSDIDARKFLSVSAPDKFAGQSNQLTMYGGSGVLIPVSRASAGRQRTTIIWASFHETCSTTIFDQADDYQEVFGSNGKSFWQRERDTVSETSVFSHSAKRRQLESRSVSAMNESLLTGKRDLSESISQSMRDRDNLLRIQEKKN